MDPRTAGILVLISGVEGSILFFLAGGLRRRGEGGAYSPSSYWGSGGAFYVAGMACLLSQGRSSPWIGVVLGNAFLVLGQMLVIGGLRRLEGRPMRRARFALVWGVHLCLIVVFTFLVPSTPIRVVLFSLVIASLYAEGAAICLMARKSSPGTLAPAMGVVFGAMAAFFVARAILAALARPSSVFSPMTINWLSFTVSHIGLVAWCLGLLLMQNQRNEIDLQRAYEEKAVFLRELQHRVKNSFSVITSLVSLEASRSEDPALVGSFRALGGRVSAIAALYDRLAREEEDGGVALDSYLRDLAEAIFAAQAGRERGIALELALEPVLIDPKRAAPVGLVLNELVTDCLKYAFPGGRRGKVRVELRREGPAPTAEPGATARIVLEVRDDGVGLPGPGAPREREGLGLVIVETLASQIEGGFEAMNEGGALFRLRFPEPPGAG